MINSNEMILLNINLRMKITLTLLRTLNTICVSILLEGVHTHIHTHVTHAHNWHYSEYWQLNMKLRAFTTRGLQDQLIWRWRLIILLSLLSRSLFSSYPLICLNELNFHSVYSTWILIQTHKMTSKLEITLEHFYIFNGTYAKKEGEASMPEMCQKVILFD